MAKRTTELLKELNRSTCSLSKYMSRNDEVFVNENIPKFWEGLVSKSGYSKSNIINKSDFCYCYFYDVISGRKLPTKDKVVRLCLAMKASLRDTQEALKISDRSQLYAKNRRDSILIFAINNKLTIAKCNALLTSYEEETLK